jgi:hypothetical protein
MLATVVQLLVATPMWDHAAMTEEEAVTRLKQAADAKRAGLKPKTVAAATGYSYETIRRIARANDIGRLREPTVTSRKKAQPGGRSPA